jgi:hypothetical protein
MKKKIMLSLIVLVAIIAVAIFTGCIEEVVPTSTKLPKIPELTKFFNPNITEQTLPYSKASGSQVCLVNYKNATEPTWNELMFFLEKDDTDEQPYIEGSFVCADFAEMLHNNAEASGIKAAFVGVDFVVGEGHALNAFNTTDRGQVYVDCTGKGFHPPVSPSHPFKENDSYSEYHHFDYSCDKIAYVVIGKEYGSISIDKATSPEYWYYKDYNQKWDEYDSALEAYNSDVEEYNKAVEAYKRDIEAYEGAVGGRTYISDSEEYEKLNKMYKALKARENGLDILVNELDALRDRLDERQEELGYYRWEPLGVVTNVDSYW